MSSETMNATLADLLSDRAWVAGLARSLVRDPHAAEDVSQETWLSALMQRRPIAAPRAWLDAVVRNHARRRARGAGRRDAREAQVARAREPGGDASPSAAEVVARFETQRSVASAVHDLDEPFRTTVLLHYFEGLSLAAIARREGVPAGTVRWRLHRAHQLLRGRLEQALGEQDWRPLLLGLCIPGARPAAVLAAVATALLVAGLGFAGWWSAGGGGQKAPVAASAGVDTPGEAEPSAPASERAAVAPPEPAASEPTPPVEESRPARSELAIVRARLVDLDGAPVHGATLALSRVGFGSFLVENGLIELANPPVPAMADGSVTLALHAPAAILDQIPEPWRPGPGSTWRLELEARAPDHAPAKTLILVRDGDALDIGQLELVAATRLRGRIVDARGRGLNGATVSVELPPLGSDPDDRARRFTVPRSDHRAVTEGLFSPGRFAVDEVPRGPVIVWASKKGYRPAWKLVYAEDAELAVGDIALQSGTAPPNHVEPEDSRTLMVRVVDADGEPVSDATLMHWSSQGRYGSCRTDDQGRQAISWFERDGVAPTLQLLAVDRDPTWRGQPADTPDRGCVARADVDPTVGEIVLRLRERPVTVVEVVDPKGQPVSGALATWRARGGSLDECWRRGDAGSVSIPQLPIGASLVVVAAGFARHVSERFDAGGFPDRLRVQLEPVRGVRGRVTAGGEPLVDATLLVLRKGIGEQGQRLRTEYRSRGLWDVKTGDGGTFALFFDDDEPTPERFRLLVRHEDYAPVLSDELPFDPASGLAGLEFELSKGGAARGCVRRADGRPMARVRVAFNDYLGHPAFAMTDGEGRFHLERLRATRYEVVLVDNDANIGSLGWSPLGSRTAAQPPRFDVVVREGETVEHDIVADVCRLAIRMQRSGVEDLRGWRASLCRAHDLRKIDTDPLAHDGVFEVASYREGPHRVLIESAGGPLGRLTMVAEVDLKRGANELAVDFELAAASGLLPVGVPAGAHRLRWEIGAFTVTAPVTPKAGERVCELRLAPVGPARLVATNDDGRDLGIVTLRR